MKVKRLPLLAATALAGLVALGAPAIAKEMGAAKQGSVYEASVYEEDAIVVRPYGVRRESVGRSPLGARVEEVSLSRVVSAHDLDLRYAGAVDELERRVSYTARLVCDELDDALRHQSSTSDRECVNEAVRNARPQVRALVDRASY